MTGMRGAPPLDDPTAPGTDGQKDRGDREDRNPEAEPVSAYGTIGTAIVVAVLGLITIPGAILLWGAVSTLNDLNTGGDAVQILVALVATSAALGVIAADFALILHLNRPGAQEWRWWTQFFILPMWVLAATAALIIAIDS